MNVIEIICLANSRKLSGRCIAGKENKPPFRWIRPVSNRESKEISEKEQLCRNGEKATVLDIIRIPIIRHQPSLFQTENHLITADKYWERTGSINKDKLKVLCDNPHILWRPTENTYWGINDRIAESKVSDISGSLYLIHVNHIRILVKNEGIQFGKSKRKVRAEFLYGNIFYRLPVTDPEIEALYFRKCDGIYQINQKCYICVSIGLPHKGYCYLFIASIII